MKLFARATAMVTLISGIAALAAGSTPSEATQADSGVIVGSATPQTFALPTAPATLIPAVATTADIATDTAIDPADLAPTRLDTVDPDAAEFQSLAAAVAAQAAPADLSTELRCLAGAVYFEAKGEPLAGQLAVAEVIINRARSGRFPRSLCGVVTQAGQFSFVRGGAVPAINPALGQWKTALAVAQVALDEAWESPASTALFFHARYVAPGWDPLESTCRHASLSIL